jgi:hypothetical protein
MRAMRSGLPDALRHTRLAVARPLKICRVDGGVPTARLDRTITAFGYIVVVGVKAVLWITPVDNLSQTVDNPAFPCG